MEITHTLSEPKWVTYTKPLTGLTATSFGNPPTGIVATTWFVVGSITDTVNEPLYY